MRRITQIRQVLAGIAPLYPMGCAVGFHVQFTSPAFMVQTYAPDWQRRYMDGGLLIKDPTVLWGMGNTGHIRWSDLSAKDSAGVLAEAATHGLKYGIVVSHQGVSDRSIGGFAREDREFSDAEAAELAQAIVAIHDLTDPFADMPDNLRSALRDLSIRSTNL